MNTMRWIGTMVVILLCLCWWQVDEGRAASFQWDRGGEADLHHYELYSCNQSATCDPIVDGARVGADILQPAVGVKPTMIIPANASGRARVLAADTVGNKSPGSNTIPFRSQALNAPTGLQQIP